MSFSDLESALMNETYTGAQLPEAIYYIGFKLTQASNVDDSIRFYQCAAKNYYDIQGMYRMASLYKNGTDSIQSQLPNAVIKNKIAVDYKQSYFWIVSLIYTAKQDKPDALDTSKDRGYNTIAILDDLQNTRKISDTDMKSIEKDAIQFIVKRYPTVANILTNVYSHGMGGSSTQTTPTNIEVPIIPLPTPSVSSVSLDSKPYVDTKNGFSIIPPKGWIVDSSGKQNSYVIFTNPNNANEWVEVASGSATTDSLSAFVKKFVSLFKVIAPKFNLSEDRDVSLSGASAHLISFSYSDTKNNNKTMRMTMVLTMKSGKAYHSGSVSDDSNWATEKSVLEASLLSFKFN